MITKTASTCRHFIKTSTAASIGIPTIIPASALGKTGYVAHSNRIILAGTGLGTCPVRFVGDKGWVEAGDHLGTESSNRNLLKTLGDNQTRETDPVLHVRNFLHCVKTREQLVCNSTVVRFGHMACFTAAISWRLDCKVTFDPKIEGFVNDDEANRMRYYK